MNNNSKAKRVNETEELDNILEQCKKEFPITKYQILYSLRITLIILIIDQVIAHIIMSLSYESLTYYVIDEITNSGWLSVFEVIIGAIILTILIRDTLDLYRKIFAGEDILEFKAIFAQNEIPNKVKKKLSDPYRWSSTKSLLAISISLLAYFSFEIFRFIEGGPSRIFTSLMGIGKKNLIVYYIGLKISEIPWLIGLYLVFAFLVFIIRSFGIISAINALKEKLLIQNVINYLECIVKSGKNCELGQIADAYVSFKIFSTRVSKYYAKVGFTIIAMSILVTLTFYVNTLYVRLIGGSIEYPWVVILIYTSCAIAIGAFITLKPLIFFSHFLKKYKERLLFLLQRIHEKILYQYITTQSRNPEIEADLMAIHHGILFFSRISHNPIELTESTKVIMASLLALILSIIPYHCW